MNVKTAWDALEGIAAEVLSLSVHASLLVGLVFVVRFFVKHRLSRQCHYLLWFLVLARLAVPVFPESHTSLFNLFDRLGHARQQRAVTRTELPSSTELVSLTYSTPQSSR